MITSGRAAITRNATGQARSGAAAIPLRSRGNGLVLQRKCACGSGASGLGGTCEECAKKRLDVQTKLALGAPGDAYEREADRAADEATRGADARAMRPSPIRLQRLSATQDGHGAQAVPDSVGRALAGSGRRIDDAPRFLMERRFGRAFEDVRIHVDEAAAQSAQDIGARAYTHGRDIAFAAGEYRPGTAAGLRLLAHELAHVVQQSGEAGAPVQRDLAIEPRAVNPKERTLSEQDVKDAVAFNKGRIKKKETLRQIRDVVGISEEPAESDRDLALGVARWQASHGVAQDGQLGPVTVMLLVEELQAEGALVSGLDAEAEKLKGEFSKGTFLDVDASFCGCKPELEAEIKKSDTMIAEYSACGADPKNKTGDDIEACVTASFAAKGITLKLLGSTSSTGRIGLTGERKGPCAKLLSRIDLAHEQIHSVHTGELKQLHGAGTAAFNKAFNDAPDWVADEINSRNTDKSLKRWAMSVLERICP